MLFADHAACDQIGVGVVVDGDDLRRPVRFALEFHIARGSILAAATLFSDRGRARRFSVMRVFAVVIFAAAAAGAEVPGGQVYVGAGAALSAASGAGPSAALFLELNYEQPRTLFTLRLIEGNARADTGLIYLLASLSGHYILLDSPWAPSQDSRSRTLAER